ncbi:MAG: transcription antitermination factor NusB [Deltaproteobacteria bacterium]|jgi:N utilization substance protein B|nr:transcription antitermination factor NusB [Deltaproteobacteria bacterium]
MQDDKYGKNIAGRRLERARAFQVIYGLFFSPAANLRSLAAVFQRTIYAEPFTGGELNTELTEDEAAVGAEGRKPILPDIHSLPREAGEDDRVFTPPAPARGEEPQGFAWELVSGVWSRQNELDELIRQFSQNWRLDRMGKVELALLRLAAFELLFRDDAPPKVVINEAIELSRQFGDENSHGFVNGILDAAVKAVESGKLKRASTFWGH